MSEDELKSLGFKFTKQYEHDGFRTVRYVKVFLFRLAMLNS